MLLPIMAIEQAGLHTPCTGQVVQRHAGPNVQPPGSGVLAVQVELGYAVSQARGARRRPEEPGAAEPAGAQGAAAAGAAGVPLRRGRGRGRRPGRHLPRCPPALTGRLPCGDGKPAAAAGQPALRSCLSHVGIAQHASAVHARQSVDYRLSQCSLLWVSAMAQTHGATSLQMLTSLPCTCCCMVAALALLQQRRVCALQLRDGRLWRTACPATTPAYLRMARCAAFERAAHHEGTIASLPAALPALWHPRLTNVRRICA